MTETIQHAPGIYFNLDANEYHADDSLGSSSVKALAVDPYEFQFDRKHGEDKDTDALTYGSAVHARILEGRAAFEAEFCPEFDKSQVPEGALITVDDLKKWLDQHDQKGLSGKAKPALIALVREIDPGQPIFDVLKGEWEKTNEGKTPLKPKRWAQVETAAKWVQRDPLLSAVMEDGTFSHGAPEVSIFYQDRGARLKARFDRLLRHAIIDVKTFAPITPGPIDGPDGSAIRTIRRMRYGIQAADYIRAWHAAKELYEHGLVFGEQPYSTFLDECFDREAPAWIWIMIKSTGAPQSLVVNLNAPSALAVAAGDVERAIDRYIENRDQFGDDEDWVPARPAFDLTDVYLPYGL